MGVKFNSGRISTSSLWTSPAGDHTVTFWNSLDLFPSTTNRCFGNNNSWEWRSNGGSNKLLHELEQTGYIPYFYMTIGQIYHISLTVDDSNNIKRIYADGEIVSNISNASFLSTLTGTLSFGSRDTSTQYWNGIIDDFRIYNRVLTSDEIKTIYACQGTDGIYDGLINWWQMDEGVEDANVTQLYDSIGGVHLTNVVGSSPKYSGKAGVRYLRNV